jgi:transcriptional regulator with XRE-family HTH domain
MPEPFDVHVGRRLRSRRRLLGLTLEEVARDCGVRFQQIQKYECASSRMSAARMWQLAGILRVPVAYFLEGYRLAPTPAP